MALKVLKFETFIPTLIDLFYFRYITYIGYLIAELNNLLILLFAVINISKTILITNDILKNYPIPEKLCVWLSQRIFAYTLALVIGFCLNLLTFTYVAWLRTPANMTLKDLGKHLISGNS